MQINQQEDDALNNIRRQVQGIKDRTTQLLSRFSQEMFMLSKTTEAMQLIQYFPQWRKHNTSGSKKQNEPIHTRKINRTILEDEFAALLKDNGLYFKVELLDNKGRKVVSIYYDKNKIYKIAKEQLPKRPFQSYLLSVSDMKAGEIRLSPSEIKLPYNNNIVPSIDCLVPIFDSRGNRHAILIASIHAKEFFKYFTLSSNDTNIKVIMVNGEGYYLYHSKKKKNWNRLLAARQEENLYKDYSKSVSDSILNGTSGTIRDDPHSIIEYASIFSDSDSKANRYIVFTEIPKNVIFSSISTLRNLFIAICIAVIALSVLTSFYTARHFIRPFNQLITGTKIISQGNLDYKLDISTGDEIDNLVSSFNQMVTHWKQKKELEQRQWLEEESRQRKKYLENIMASSLDLLITLSSDRKLSYTNQRLADMLGYNPEQLKGRDYLELFPPTYQNFISQKWQTVRNLSSGTQAGILYEASIMKADGSLIDCLISHSQLKGIDEHLAIIKDITERKRAEQELKNSEIRYRSLFETAKIGIIIINTENCKIENVNPYLTEMLGYSLNEFIGKNCCDTEPFKNIADKIGLNQTGSQEKLNLKFKFDNLPITTKNNEQIFIEFVGNAYTVSGKRYIQCNIKNITERKLAEDAIILAKERAEEVSRLKTNFLSNMGHELRTPMIGILGFSKLLEKSESLDDAKEIGNLIYQSSNRLMQTLNMILEISRIESGELKIVYSDIDLVELVQAIFYLFEDTANEKNLYLKIYPEYSHFNINSDKRLLESILKNLIDNAIKFTSTGGVTVSFRNLINNHQSVAILNITDTGIGIPKENMDIIFQDFRQGSEGIDRKYDGTGLGLTLAHKYIAALEGKISVDSKINQGTTFTVTLPVNRESVI